jgi:hypothetical protein
MLLIAIVILLVVLVVVVSTQIRKLVTTNAITELKTE